MPKRIVDGDALWRSDKLAQVEPLSFRGEFANLLPLALANGTFEAAPRRIWASVYSYNRPDVTLEVVEAILDEFERVKLLFRWQEERSGKTWGYWVGVEKPGRLPSQSRQRKKHETVGATPPAEQLKQFTNAIDEPMVSHSLANGEVGSGSGSGLGSGNGKGKKLSPSPIRTIEVQQPSKSGHEQIAVAPENSELMIRNLVDAHPRNLAPMKSEKAATDAIIRETTKFGSAQAAYEYLLDRTKLFAKHFAKWSDEDKNWGASCESFFAERRYEVDEKLWSQKCENVPRPSKMRSAKEILRERELECQADLKASTQ